VAEPRMHCDIARWEKRVIVGVHGDVDLATAPELEHAIAECLAPGLSGIVIDLAYCTFMDSQGVAAQLRLRNRAASLDVDFRLTSIPRPISLVFAASGLAAELGVDVRLGAQ
jgi:anti-sigma B factor antagonist